ncbi:hypothetical protein J5N97_019382 [Dioscorea zingiberensis]|uniref:MMS19 nucleotide excision repair protein n=1 Tax=Dioscorea zingiberensis TaxID=325984 RepID=A0A9D5CEU8_9LILI|nr:hypothetical protein J5N97_019382 [Dioscorea zingiberensis]
MGHVSSDIIAVRWYGGNTPLKPSFCFCYAPFHRRENPHRFPTRSSPSTPMANPSSWISHVEAFVDDSALPNQKLASVDAIAALVKKDLLTLETLVREMELYLTTPDHIIRSRGTILLAEVLTRIMGKSLNASTIGSLVEFFTSRLADWQALCGALIGCLALLRRKDIVGMVKGGDAKRLAKSFLKNVQVQSLAVDDRKRCFEVLQCLLDTFPENMVTLGDDLVYGICDAIDEEKDPRCLLLTFHLVETLVQLFPDPHGFVADFANDLFEILGRYFPVYFTHQRSDDLGITRDELSGALMRAFCSTPYFEPLAVPLLLEKLSSSLPLAKLDSLRYLNDCISCYGAVRMMKYAETVWSALKDTIFSFSTRDLSLPSTVESVREMEPLGAQIAKAALNCLRTALSELNYPNAKPFLSLIVEDEDIEKAFNFVSGEGCYPVPSKESQSQLYALGSILSTSSKVSSDCCDRIFQKFFTPLMDMLGVSPSSTVDAFNAKSYSFLKAVSFGAIYICVELLSACRDLTLSTEVLPQQVILLHDEWFCLFKRFATPLTYSLGSMVATPDSSILVNEDHRHEVVGYAVKGLQVLTTFPECYSPISQDAYKDTLAILVNIITDIPGDSYVWRLSLNALIQIGLFIDKFNDSQKAICYREFVVQRILLWVSLDDSSVRFAQKLESVYEIGMTGREYMLAVTQWLEQAIFAKILEACVNCNFSSAEILLSMLKCYSHQVLPWFHKANSFDEVAMPFAINVWKLMGDNNAFNVNFKDQVVLDTIMMTMKLVVSGCTEENQVLIVQKGYTILLSTRSLFSEEKLAAYTALNSEGSESAPDSVCLACKDEWLISLFSSVLIALRPRTPIPDVKLILKLLMFFSLKGHVPATQALASMINKWPESRNETEESNVCSFEEAIELIFEMDLSSLIYSCPFRKLRDLTSNEEINLLFLKNDDKPFLIHALEGLTWIGKGLLMRGHEKVKEIVMLFMKCLLSNQDEIIKARQDGSADQYSFLARSAADAFHILLCDSDECLNKRFHATIKPLYKQRFFSSIIMVLLSSIKESDSKRTRAVLFRAFGHVISNTPLAAVVMHANKVLPPLLDALSVLTSDAMDKDLIYSLLMLLSGILMDDSGKEAVMNNIHLIIGHLTRLISYPHMMIVRETAIQCLVAMSGLPHARIYPMRPQVLRAVSNALDDRKRTVRLEAVKCHQAWSSIASRSLHF